MEEMRTIIENQLLNVFCCLSLMTGQAENQGGETKFSAEAIEKIKQLQK